VRLRLTPLAASVGDLDLAAGSSYAQGVRQCRRDHATALRTKRKATNSSACSERMLGLPGGAADGAGPVTGGKATCRSFDAPTAPFLGAPVGG